MLHSFKPNITLIARKGLSNRMLPIRVSRAVNTTSSKQTRYPCNPNPEYLFSQNVIDSLLQVWNLFFQSFGESVRDLSQEDAGLSTWVKKLYRLICPNIRTAVISSPRLSERIEHLVSQIRRREYLIVREIRYAGQNIGIMQPKIQPYLRIHDASFMSGGSPKAESSAIVIGGHVLLGLKISCFPKCAKSDPSAVRADD
jgi:hypothetical protein